MTIIEKRTERIKFWLTDKELKQIDRKAKRLGMNRSEYIRHLIANCKLVHTPNIDYESYYKRLKYISDEINHHLIVLNQIGTLDEPRFNHLCEDAVKTAKELSDELTEKLDIEIEKSKVVKA
ncbi:Ribbon-helix-helix protein, copG family [[Eubacterium] siraeum 70/3]|uniref:Ribbon-helix-helix protein, copG family n=1 Tax=[Eubacterium] siraeum 70/3 TaxID=657319 RepID=D4JS70_9FIRM|nr:Ribbon-helix-helix protein, copG family [[Eubacterium] siraeum 70/3]